MSKEDLSYYLTKVTTEKRIPISCHLDLTYQCNLNCSHCYVVKENRDELKTSEVLNIIEQLANLGTLYLNLSGGEIFTREDFFEIAEYARDMHFALNISTNGTLIDEKMADRLSALNLQQINFSIYSTNPKIHDKITGVPGSLKKTIEAIKILKNRDIHIRIVNIILKQNINEYANIYKMAKKLGLKIVFDPKITPKTDGNMLPLNNQINEDDLYRIFSDPLLKLNLTHDTSKDPINITTDIPCAASHTTFYISPYGDVYPCVQFPLLCGDIKEKSLHDIWFHSPQMLKVSDLRISQLPVCSKCEIRDYCNYCPGLSILEKDNIMIPPTRCCKEAELLSSIKR